MLASVVVLSLGAGIGVNAVVFSWIQAVLLHPLPGVANAAALYSVEPRRADGTYVGLSWRDYLDLRERLSTFPALLAFRMAPLYVGRPGETERAYGLLVSDNYFPALGLVPALGRFLTADEVSTPGGPPVLVISFDYWQTRFGGSSSVLGAHLRVNGMPLAIVGVAPRGFQGTVPRLKFDLFLPATLAPIVQPGSQELDSRMVRGYAAMGALRAGVSRRVAQQDVNAAMDALARAHPEADTGIVADALPLWEAPRGPQKLLAIALVTLQGILVLLLLSVCGNTANLMLARATARQREIGTRLALGASPSRVASLLLTENVTLAMFGAVAGMGIASWGTSALRAMPPLRVRGLPITFETAVTPGTLLFAALLGVGCGVLFGLPAAVRFATANPQSAIRSGHRGSGRSALRNGIMGVQMALATVVLLAGGLVLRSFLETRAEPTGFRRSGILLAAYDLTGRSLTPENRRTFADRVLRAVRSVPGVRGAAMASSVPLDLHGLPSRAFTVEGGARTEGGFDEALTNTVSPGYFEVMNIPLVAGRDFADLADSSAPRQVIVDEAFVREYLHDAQPLGRRIVSRGRTYVICGVAKNSLYNAFGEPPLPIVYYSYRDNPLPASELHIQTRDGGEAGVAAGVRRAIRGLDPELPVYDVRTMNDHIESNLLFTRIPARMFVVLGPLLLALAGIGIAGVVSYAASLRRAEIGIRLALGATPSRVVREFVGETLTVVGAGALVGWVLAVLLVLDYPSGGRVDPIVFAAVPGMLLMIAAGAAWWPAHRAAARNAWSVLRQE